MAISNRVTQHEVAMHVKNNKVQYGEMVVLNRTVSLVNAESYIM